MLDVSFFDIYPKEQRPYITKGSEQYEYRLKWQLEELSTPLGKANIFNQPNATSLGCFEC